MPIYFTAQVPTRNQLLLGILCHVKNKCKLLVKDCNAYLERAIVCNQSCQTSIKQNLSFVESNSFIHFCDFDGLLLTKVCQKRKIGQEKNVEKCTFMIGYWLEIDKTKPQPLTKYSSDIQIVYKQQGRFPRRLHQMHSSLRSIRQSKIKEIYLNTR